MKKTNHKRIFLDYASITPIDLRVEKKMLEIQKKFWANPSSLHLEGELAKKVFEDSRTKIAKILHCRSNEIIFTSGGTESLNLAIQGVIKNKIAANKKEGINKPLHIIAFALEHPAILEPMKMLSQEGIEISLIAPNEKGLINPESVLKEIKENTVLIIVQYANNEIGMIQPIQKISALIKEYRKNKKDSKDIFYPYLLVDASQSVLYENVSIERLGADMLVLDGIKMYGPRGMGLLVIKHGIKISPVFWGGGQENGLRAGTENVAGAVGLAEALEITEKLREKEFKRLTILRNYAVEKILKEIPSASLNGSLENRLPNNINICIPKADSEFLVIKLDTLGFAVSAASACHTLSLENSSFVIKAIGKPECASSSLRITFGRETTKSDIDKFISALKNILK